MDTFQTFLNACRNGQKNIVKLLLERGGIDLNRRDAEGNTPLHYVCRQGFRDLAALLLDRGADPSQANNRSETPLHTAARSGNREIIARLVEAGADPDASDREGCTPLMRLVENRRTDAALWLIDRGVDIEATDQTGHRVLDYATALGLTEVVARLSRGGSGGADSRDAEGNTLLHQAVYNDQAEVVRTLLAASKAQLDAPNDAGETPLLVACERGNLHIARMLLDAGADANRPLTNGTTPLHWAAQAGNRFLVEALLGAGAAIDARNGVGETAMLVAHVPGTTRSCACLWSVMPKSMRRTTSSTRRSTMPENAASRRSSNCCSRPAPKDKMDREP